MWQPGGYRRARAQADRPLLRYSAAMLARYQQFSSFVLLFAAAWATCVAWPLGWVGACLLGLGVLLSYTAWIALAMFIAARLNRSDPAPTATMAQWVHAWWHECVATWQVFVWRQPFRANAQADALPDAHATAAQRPGVVLVHGFLCNRAFWTPYMQALKAQGTPFIAVNLEPVFGSIDDYPAIIENAVQTLATRTQGPVHLLCHSMGGLAARAWLQRFKGYTRVGRIITIGTPHHGTALSVASPYPNTRQMERFSAWQQQLEQLETPGQQARFVCWFSPCDNVVLPASTATLHHADNRLVRARGHVDMAFDPMVMRETLALLAQE